MADLFSGGAVGALIGELLKKTIQTIKNAGDFGSTLQTSIETVDALSPLLEKIKGTKDEDIVRLETHIREIEDLVEISKNLKRKRTWWKYLAFSTYQAKLQKKDLAFQRHLAVHGQMKMLVTVTQILEISMVVSADLKVVSADVKEVSADVKEVSADVKEVSADVKEVSADVKLILERLDGNQVRGCCGAPEEPQCMGMDELLTQLKVEMMSGGVLVRVLTGLGESGKTTLAKKLCSDPQIKGKFGGNIFFITVSATPNLKNIVQTLFEYCGLRVPEFHNDEDAINRLRFLLSQVGRNPILIVLDDVLPGSESLVEKFQFEMLKFQMQDCKILLTSRAVAFRRFGTHCQLYRLDQNHQHAVSLFAQLNHSSSYMPDKNLVHEIVKGYRGSPLGLPVVVGSLCRQQPFDKWQYVKERLMNPTILGRSSSFYSKITTETDMYFNNLNVTMHDLHGELAIHQSKREPFEQRKRTFQIKKKIKQRKRQEIIDLNAMVKKNDALQIRITKLVGVIVALSCVVMLLLFLVVIY